MTGPDVHRDQALAGFTRFLRDGRSRIFDAQDENR